MKKSLLKKSLFISLLFSFGAYAQSPQYDVLIVGGTFKAVEKAYAERSSGKSVYLVTPFAYLGEDMAGTLELGFGEDAPEHGLKSRLWANASGHAPFDYWMEPKCSHPQSIFRNDKFERLSEPRNPATYGDMVYHDTNVSVRCVLRSKDLISNAEVIVVEGEHSHAGDGATEGVEGVFLDGPRKGEKIEFTRRDAAFDVGYPTLKVVSYTAPIGSAVGKFEVIVRKSSQKKCQYLSRIWFHLANPAKSVSVPSPLKVKRTLDAIMVECGAEFITSSPVTDVIKENGKITGVEITNRSGKKIIRAKEVIDATRYGVLDGFGKTFRVGKTERFSRIVIVSGEPPSYPNMKVEQLPGDFRVAHTRAEGKVYRCTMDLPMKDGSFASFAAAEWQAREMTWCSGMLDDADLLVWHPSTGKPIREEKNQPVGVFDVAVVGGGTSGAPAGIAAARSGAKTLIAEYINVLGGVGTDGMILGYYDGNHCGFTEEFKAMNAAVGARYGLYARAETWRRMSRDAGVTVWFGAMGIGAICEGTKVSGVRIGTEFGPVEVRATSIIDATGNSDIAAAAGSETEFIGAAEFALQSAGQSPHRLARHGVNSDFGFLDDSDAFDLWLFGLRARAGAPDAWDLAKMPNSRERRRVIPDYMLTCTDVAANRTFPDTVVQARSRQDAHGYIRDVFGYVAEDSAERKVLSGRPRAQFSVNVPLRSLLPKGLSGLAVIGVGSGVERDVQPMIRMQADLMNMGYAVGIAAVMSVREGGEFRKIDYASLRRSLVKIGILSPETPDWNTELDVTSDAAIARAVKSVADDFKGSHILWRKENRAKAVPLLRSEFASAKTQKARQIYAVLLGMFGDDSGVDVLVDIVNGKITPEKTRIGGNFGEFNNGGDHIAGFMIALGRTRNPKALKPLLAKLAEITPSSKMRDIRAATLALEALGSSDAAPALAEKLKMDGFHGFVASDWRTLTPQGGYGNCPELNNSVRELAILRALHACGDYKGIAQKSLEAYARDPRTSLARHAKAVLARKLPVAY